MGAPEATTALLQQHTAALASARNHKRLARHHRRQAALRQAQAEETRRKLAALGIRLMTHGEAREERHDRNRSTPSAPG
jgi:hypothetical protein